MPRGGEAGSLQAALPAPTPMGPPPGDPFQHPTSCRASGKRIKTQTCCQSWKNKQIKEPQTQRQQNQQAARRRLRPPRTPKQPRPGVPCLPSRGDGHSPPPWDKPELLVGLAELPPRLLTLLGSAGRASRASSWTLGSRHERQPRSWAVGAAGCPAEAVRLPFSSPRNATTSLRGRWGSAKQLGGRPAPACLFACEPRPLRHGRTWTSHQSRDAPGNSRGPVGCRRLVPGTPREGCSRESWKEGLSQSSPSGSGRVAHPQVSDVFRKGMDAARRSCLPAAGDSCGGSPPRARRASASPPTAGEIRSSAGPHGARIRPLLPVPASHWAQWDPSPGRLRSQLCSPQHAMCVPPPTSHAPLWVFSPCCFRTTHFYPFPSWAG